MTIALANQPAPRITESDVEAAIVSEHSFSAYDAAVMAAPDLRPVPEQLGLLTICVLVLANGFTVTGESACVSAANYDPDIDRRLAAEDARSKVWRLLGYALRDRLHHAPRMHGAIAELQVVAATCSTNMRIHLAEGNTDQAALSGANAISCQAALTRLQATA
jgi:hypothetical protein